MFHFTQEGRFVKLSKYMVFNLVEAVKVIELTNGSLCLYKWCNALIWRIHLLVLSM